ncbi:hypothetical protein KBB49_01365 [Candidatus Saccharibacteria bacterium]|nr:hypothetical protein [Candidatus Saccharibacteria bacterium]
MSSLFTFKLPIYYTYMLQQVEYNPSKFWAWMRRLTDDNKSVKSVMTRKTLVLTGRAKMLVFAGYSYFALTLILIVFFIAGGMSWVFFLCSIFYWIIISVLTLKFFYWCLAVLAFLAVVKPEQKRLVSQATKIFQEHKAVKIAVLGSYGKTTYKEMLATALSEGKNIAVTPGNMNVSVSHARFAKKLTGDEDVIIVEFGEGEPGDIARMAKMLEPDYAVITGLAPNHLDLYPNLAGVAVDLLSIYDFVELEDVFVNGESKMLQSYLPANAQSYTAEGLLDWKTNNIDVSVTGLKFNIVNGEKTIKVNSELLGRHQVAPLSSVVVLADKLGLNLKTIEKGISKTKPYEHRMQPRLVQGAWLIDDTYNGNLEGLQAGLKLLSELPAKRKWYVTPGLVDQGSETDNVHVELGKSIAECNPNIVVLMENSVRPIIQKSMEDNGFSGELRVEKNPLEFYTNIEHLVAVGDIVLMQNDWTDNYS